MNARQKKWLAIGVALMLLGGLKIGLIVHYLRQASRVPVQTVACNDLGRGCRLPGGGSVHFVTPPANGRPFEIVLTGAGGQAPSAEFSMQGMDMGFNRYRFVADGKVWRARVTLPVCSTGRADWLMTLEVDGRHYQLGFTVS
ncbi:MULTISPECIES: hypothetical protein [Gulbenkiania]|uniref:Uncharacterized protein n=2 Tax=Gulbenkiania TaxID=397456 RepID=A0A0K6GS94_9NEIS|nr:MULTISPECIES: hypothetical protein [Gulbenkiania]TCW32295.1 hypothetical protein EV669_103211 [Gulbenkiania mobilis]CUA81565.1 hypothetical protein Ga0061063_0407 [Gulbenkiania indica]